jgi:hypothetical protein
VKAAVKAPFYSGSCKGEVASQKKGVIPAKAGIHFASVKEANGFPLSRE